MDQCVHTIREQQWLEIVNAANASGQTIMSFCNEHGISRRQFYYHQAKIRKQAYEQLCAREALVPASSEKLSIQQPFVQVPVATTPQPVCSFQPAAVLCIGSVTVSVAEGVSEDLLMNLGKMIHNAL